MSTPPGTTLQRPVRSKSSPLVAPTGNSETPLTPVQIEWADIIFVMEKTHRQKLNQKFRKHINGKRVICLDIPDTNTYMQAELVTLLEKKVGRFLR